MHLFINVKHLDRDYSDFDDDGDDGDNDDVVKLKLLHHPVMLHQLSLQFHLHLRHYQLQHFVLTDDFQKTIDYYVKMIHVLVQLMLLADLLALL